MRLAHYTIPKTTPSTPIKIYTDATYHEGTGHSAVGWLFTDHNGQPLTTHGTRLGTGYTSVQAENAGVKRAVGAVSHHPAQHIKVYTDCKPTLEQLQNVDLAKDDFESVTLEWVPREKNRVADSIAFMWATKGERKGRTTAGTKFGVCD